MLGPVRAWRGPDEVDLGPPQQRAILALLLVRSNRLVSVEDMIELLWEQDPPGSAVNAIHKYVGSIRRLLEPDLEARTSGRWLTRHGGTYRLAVDESTSDLIAFRRTVKDAQTARADGRPADSLDLLMEALALARGACGEGLDLRGRNRNHFTAVDQEYVAAVADAADAALVSAQAPRVLPMLRQLACDEPLNEPLQARLVLVLGAAGRQAQALSYYQLVRERLRDELGVDPGEEMRAAYGKVLRQEFSAFADDGRAGSVPKPGSPGASAESAGMPDESEPADTPSERAVWSIAAPRSLAPLVPPAQLPADLPVFVGREEELSFLSEALGPGGEPPGAGVCAIAGMPGIGKTTFAVHWAHLVAKHFADGQMFLDLRGFDASASPTTPADALRALLCSLGIATELLPDSLDALVAMHRSLLADKRVLIVLDNAHDVEQIRPLLPGSPGSLVVATSRNPLTGLAVAQGAQLLTLDLFPPATAKEVLRRRLGAARVAAEPEAVEQIIRLSGRLPLALALLSARAVAHPDFPLASIADDLRRTRGRRGHLDVFGAAGGAADARSVFSWSYRRLSPPARRMFRLLSLRPGPDVTAAAAAGLLDVQPEEASRLIAELTGTSLFAEDRPGRYFCHPLVSAYAGELSECADSEADRREAQARLLDHHLRSGPGAERPQPWNHTRSESPLRRRNGV
ncbi:hypothetical protein GCM10023196_004170 [Actinoallomurus vinaceus]|uniref:OmpR/PhoB-type domain-containing protein n=1 Tax=Actinoallomurus vinaceus TaxID=1080074 RepID=A0ABP8TZL8_9ACTN